MRGTTWFSISIRNSWQNLFSPSISRNLYPIEAALRVLLVWTLTSIPDLPPLALSERYWSYIGDPAIEAFHNPLVDRAYREAPYVSESFVAEMDALLAQEEEFGGILADPILQAQDIPAGFTVVLGPADDIVTVNLRFGESVSPVQVRIVQEDGQWLIRSIIPRGSTLPAP